MQRKQRQVANWLEMGWYGWWVTIGLEIEIWSKSHMSYLHSMPFARHEIRCLDWVSQRLCYVQPIIGDGIDTRWPFGLSIDMSQLEVKMQFSPCLTKPFFLQSRNSCCIFGARYSHEFCFSKTDLESSFLRYHEKETLQAIKKGSRVAILQDTFVFWLMWQPHLTKPSNYQTANFFHWKESRFFRDSGRDAELFRILSSRDVDFSSAECNGVLKILRCWPQVSDIDRAHCDEFPLCFASKKGCTLYTFIKQLIFGIKDNGPMAIYFVIVWWTQSMIASIFPLTNFAT